MPYDAKLEITEGFWCPECEQVVAKEDATSGPVYQCGGCEERAPGSDDEKPRCESCNRRMKKFLPEDADVCPECEKTELEEVDVVECPECGESLDAEVFDDHAGDCDDLKAAIRRGWAEDAVAGVPGFKETPAGPVDFVVAVRCPCETLVEVDEYPDHAAECDDTAGEEDVVSEWVQSALALASAARVAASKAKP